MKSLKGVVVYDKNLRRTGKVIREDSFSIYIEFPPLQGASPEYIVVTPGTFKRRFEFVDVVVAYENKPKPKVLGSVGDGKKLYANFIEKLKNLINTEISIARKRNVLNILYKNVVVLKVSIQSRRLVILADPSALSPQVYSRVSRIIKYGKLRARFDVYDEKGVGTFFTSLIIDVTYNVKRLEE